MSLVAGRVLVVGAGVTGRAVVDALRTRGTDVVVADQNHATLEALPDDVETFNLDDARPLLRSVDLVVPSPGVPETSTLLLAAADMRIPVWSEPELASRLFPDRRIVGITGTNGKTSVTELTTAMLHAGGVPARACGNIGTPLLTAATETTNEVLVAELSSFQLRYATDLRCRVGALLNIAPDHLDWHGDLASYSAAKARIWHGQLEDDWSVVPQVDPTIDRLVGATNGSVARFSGDSPVAVGVGVRDAYLHVALPGLDAALLAVDELTSAAPHHRANTAAAALVALLTGANPTGVAAAAARFRPGAHRGEAVGTVGGVTWLDDSKATNGAAAAAALASPVPGGGLTVWIAGGQAKGARFDGLAASLTGVRHVVVMGEAADQIEALAAGLGLPFTRVPDGEEPMVTAVAAAAAVARPGDRVLLSPACASFDQFAGYADRGDRFVAAVRELADQSSQ